MLSDRVGQGNLSINTTVVAVPDQVSTNLEDEAVILNLKDGVYYGLNPVGARIWQLIQAPRTIKEILETLLEEYDIEPQRCEQDLLKLLKELAAKQLIEVKNVEAA
jgi:hypothetical protein